MWNLFIIHRTLFHLALGFSTSIIEMCELECIKSVDELSMRVGKAAAGPRIRPSHMAGFFPSCL